jgi:thioredoxin 1
MSATHVTDNQFEEEVLKSSQPVLVDFWAEWCGPCLAAGPVLDSLADKYQDKLTIAKINVDENPQTSGQYGIMSIPTVILFKNGQEIDRQIGYAGEVGYQKLIDKGLG